MCIALDRSHPYATNNLAYIYILMAKYEEAARVCKCAFETNPSARNYFRNWAVALLNAKRWSKAVDAIKQAIDIDRGDASTDFTCTNHG